jgi:hypothetical protein
MTAPHLPETYSALLPTLWWQVLSWLPYNTYGSNYPHEAEHEADGNNVTDISPVTQNHNTLQQYFNTEKQSMMQLLQEVQHLAATHEHMQQGQTSIWQQTTHTVTTFNNAMASLAHVSTHSHMQGNVWGGIMVLHSVSNVADAVSRYADTATNNSSLHTDYLQQHFEKSLQYEGAAYAYMPQLSAQLQTNTPLYEYMGDTYTTALQQWAQENTLRTTGNSYSSYAPQSDSSYSVQELNNLFSNTENSSIQTNNPRPVHIQVGKLVEQITIHQTNTADSIQDMQQQVEDALLHLLSITNSLPQD